MSIPESIVREIERAIRGAEFPSGMSVHDGKAKVDSSHLRRLLAELAALRADAEIGQRWKRDNSLETWFPYTAEELTRLRAELVAAREDAERYRVARAKVCIVGDAFHVINLRPTYVAPDAAIEFDAAIDAARGGER